MANIKDVAEEAGVSIATVSYVLNHSRKVRPETAARVQAAAKRLGYTQNLVARNLVLGRNPMLGLIVSDIQNPFFAEVTKNFQHHASLNDFGIIIMDTNYDTRQTLECVKRLIGLQVMGVAIMTSEMNPSVINLLTRKGIRAVYLDLGLVDQYSSNIAVNYGEGIRGAIQHLHELGHRRIGFIGGPPNFQSLDIRKQSFIESRHDPATSPVMETDGSFQGGYFACARLLANHNLTAIICGNDMVAVGAIHSAFDLGLPVPERLSIVGYDNISFTEYTQPALTTVSIPRDQISANAFTALTEMFSSQPAEGREYHVETELIVRQSTAPAPDDSILAAGAQRRLGGGSGLTDVRS